MIFIKKILGFIINCFLYVIPFSQVLQLLGIKRGKSIRESLINSDTYEYIAEKEIKKNPFVSPEEIRRKYLIKTNILDILIFIIYIIIFILVDFYGNNHLFLLLIFVIYIIIKLIIKFRDDIRFYFIDIKNYLKNKNK